MDQGKHNKLQKIDLVLDAWKKFTSRLAEQNFFATPIFSFFRISKTFTRAKSLTAYVKFRNASQDERLSIITRMNLLELIELRARSWQVADGSSTYYKHKVPNISM